MKGEWREAGDELTPIGFAELKAVAPVEKPRRIIYNYGRAGVAELADARDSKSREAQTS